MPNLNGRLNVCMLLTVCIAAMPGLLYAASTGGENINFSDDRCMHNCMDCGRWEGYDCCTICNDFTGGGGGGTGFGMCVSAGCTDISSRTEWQDPGSSASVLGETGATSSSNVCFDIDGVEYYVKSATACKSDFTRKQFVILGCPSDITFYKCLYNYTAPVTGDECNESTCIPTAWTLVTSGNDAVQQRTNRGCGATGACTTVIPDEVRCPTGYYGTPAINIRTNTITAYCTPCPTHSSGTQTTAGPGGVAGNMIGGGGQNPGTVDITECYLPSGIEGTDSTGTWIYDDKCHYSN